MLIWVKESRSGNQIAINTKSVIAVFEVMDENEAKGKTALSLTNGNVVVEDSLLEVVARINAGEQ
jgi:uncharacterized protein YlzI (FlbEa/FlbD family)